MKQHSVNPYCTCPECRCPPPCTCGLELVGRSTQESWDANRGELTYTVTDTFRHRPPVTPPPTAPGGQGEAGHGGHGEHHHEGHNHGGTPATADPAQALAETAGIQGPVLTAYRNRQAAGAPTHSHASLRTATYKGHTITIQTTYEAAIDGKPLAAHFEVTNNGNVHYHGLPNYTSGSAIDLLCRVIDSFPDDFPTPKGEG